jgi:hypothetical protein
MKRSGMNILLKADVYARHGREPFGSEHFGLELNAERLKAEGLMGCPFDPAQGKGSPLYVNPVNC